MRSQPLHYGHVETPRPRGAFLPGAATRRRATWIGIEKFNRLRPQHDRAWEHGQDADVDAARVIEIAILHAGADDGSVRVVTLGDERPVVTPRGDRARRGAKRKQRLSGRFEDYWESRAQAA